MAKTFNSFNPATGEVVGRYPIMTPKEVAAVVEQAREAADGWAKQGFSGRKRTLLAWSTYIVNNVEQISQFKSVIKLLIIIYKK